MFTLLVFFGGIAVGAAFRDQIYGLKGKATRAYKAAVDAYNR